MADGSQILSYNLNSFDISTRELDKIVQMRNIDFNNRTERKFESMVDEINEEFSTATRKEMQNEYLSYLSEEDQSYYQQNSKSWNNEEALSFWNSHLDSVTQTMEQRGMDSNKISSFQSNLRSWNMTEAIDAQQDSIRAELTVTQAQIQSLQSQIDSLEPGTPNYDYTKLSLQNELEYHQSMERRYHEEMKQTITRYSFDMGDSKSVEYFQSMLEENNIPYAATKVNSQFVVCVNQTFEPQIQGLASQHEDMNLTTYREKWVSSTYKQENADGTISYVDKSDAGAEAWYDKKNDIGANFAYSIVNPMISMGMREVSQVSFYVNTVGRTLDNWANADEHRTMLSHMSVRDWAYEQNFQILENQNARMEFIEKKYGISREEVFDSLRGHDLSDQSENAVDIRVIGQNKYEIHELEGFMRDKETLDMLSSKYNISFEIVKQENTISNVTSGTKLGINKESMTKFSMALNDANARLLNDLQGRLVFNGKSMIVNGRLDLNMLKKSGLKAKDLGISEKEFKFLQDMAGRDPMLGVAIIGSGARLMTSVFRNVGKYSDSDYSWMQQIQQGVNVGQKIFDGTKKIVEFKKNMDYSDFSMKLKSRKKPKVNKKKQSSLNTKKKSLEKAPSKIKSQSASIEKARQTEAKRLVAKQKWEKSVFGKLNKAKEYFVNKTAVGKIAQVVTKAFSAAMKFVAKWGLIGALFVTAFLTIIIVIAMVIFAVVPGLMDEPETEDTAMYKLYEHGMALENDWIEGLKDTDAYFRNREKLSYGTNWQFWTKINGQNQYYRYVDAKVANARSDGDKVYINPFDFKPAKKIENDVEHRVDKFDGGVNVEIISNFNIDIYTDENGKTILGENHWKHGGGHTCNVKDILCMLDVMLGFETTGSWDDQSLQDSTAQIQFKDAWKNIKHGSKLIGYGIGSAFEAIGGSTEANAFGAWAEEMEAGSGSVGYYAMQGYMDGLFNMSHQEKIELEVVKFPVVTPIDKKIKKADMMSDGNGLQMAYNEILTECPGDKKEGILIDDDGHGNMIHACQHYDDFKPFFYDKNLDVTVPYNIPVQFVKGIEGDDGKMHPVKNEVYFTDGDAMCIDARVVNATTKNQYAMIWNDYVDNDHWEHTEEKDEGIYNGIDGLQTSEMNASQKADWDNHYNGQTEYYVTRDFGGNSTSQWIKIEKRTYSQSTETKSVVVGKKKEKYIEWCGGFDCEEIPGSGGVRWCPGHEKEREVDDKKDVTVCTMSSKVEVLRWQENETCKGHTGYYCGGHFRCNVTGVVYSMKNDDVKYVLGEMEDGADSYYLTPPVGVYKDDKGKLLGKEVDYSTAEKAKNTGLNIAVGWDMWSPNYYTVFDSKWDYKTHYPDTVAKLLSQARLWEDIFDVDHSVEYGKMNFTYANYREYEGWNEDNMTIALMKYGQDWKELYGFDIPTEIGFGNVDYADIAAIDMALSEKYGADYGKVRQHVVNLALTAVGNGKYDSDAHHWHAYTATKHGSTTCTASDCSGFASYPLIQTQRDLNVKLNVPYNSGTKVAFAWSCSELAGFTNEQGATIPIHDQSPYKAGTEVVRSDFSNCKPGDIISKKTGAGEGGSDPNHSVVFIGVLDEELVLPSSGYVIKPGMPMIVDCTTLTPGGNIYFRGYNDDTSKTGGFAPWGKIQNWPSAYKKGDRSLWVRDITYGTELQ